MAVLCKNSCQGTLRSASLETREAPVPANHPPGLRRIALGRHAIEIGAPHGPDHPGRPA